MAKSWVGPPLQQPYPRWVRQQKSSPYRIAVRKGHRQIRSITPLWWRKIMQRAKVKIQDVFFLGRIAAHLALLLLMIAVSMVHDIDFSSYLESKVSLTKAPTATFWQSSRADDTLLLNWNALPQTIVKERPAAARLDTISYEVRPGDTSEIIAERFNLKANTIIWSNPTVEDNYNQLNVGQHLIVPPIDGVLHTVMPGDSIAALAAKYRVNSQLIVEYGSNNLTNDTTPLVIGQHLMIPGGIKGEKPAEPIAVEPVPVKPTPIPIPTAAPKPAPVIAQVVTNNNTNNNNSNNNFTNNNNSNNNVTTNNNNNLTTNNNSNNNVTNNNNSNNNVTTNNNNNVTTNNNTNNNTTTNNNTNNNTTTNNNTNNNTTTNNNTNNNTTTNNNANNNNTTTNNNANNNNTTTNNNANNNTTTNNNANNNTANNNNTNNTTTNNNANNNTTTNNNSNNNTTTNNNSNTNNTTNNNSNTDTTTSNNSVSDNNTYIGSTGCCVWPVRGRVTQGVSTWHTALDIATYYGAPVYAADGGRVIAAGWDSTGYGYRVIIYHSSGISTLYAHFSRHLVNYGEYVNKGQLIGRVGSSGYSTGPHLHFEVRRNNYRQSPWNWLP